MDKTSRKILKKLKQSPDFTLWYYDDPYVDLEMSDQEFFRCVRYLNSLGLIEFVENQNGVHMGIILSHTALHSSELKRDSFLNWLLHSYIGGVIIGVTSALAGEGAIYLFAKILPILLQLLSQQ